MVQKYRKSIKTGKKFVNITIASKLRGQYKDAGPLKFHAERLCSKSITGCVLCTYHFHDGSYLEIEREVKAVAPTKFDAAKFFEKEKAEKQRAKF